MSQNRGIVVINEVASILEGLQSDPERAMVLLEKEDRFFDSTSSHDQLTRLALAIETDVEAPAVPNDQNNWIRLLRDRIERLQLANKEIHGDVCDLRTNFQVNVSSSYYMPYLSPLDIKLRSRCKIQIVDISSIPRGAASQFVLLNNFTIKQ